MEHRRIYRSLTEDCPYDGATGVVVENLYGQAVFFPDEMYPCDEEGMGFYVEWSELYPEPVPQPAFPLDWLGWVQMQMEA